MMRTAIPLLFVFLFVLISICYLFFGLWFCRRPTRSVPSGEKLIVSPANGHIARAERYEGDIATGKWNGAVASGLTEGLPRSGWFVLIVMTPLNVHYQRSPVAGRVERIRYVRGSFRNAVLGSGGLGALENERNEMTLSTRHGRIRVVQIAGYLARRISCYVSLKQKVDKGALLGFINLGSQVALLLPDHVRLRVRPGDRVMDGETIIGEFA